MAENAASRPDFVLAAAIEYAREGRASHVAWAEHLAAGDCECCTAEVVNTAGDAAVQREWVRKYDVILTALELVEETLTVRLVDAVARISDEEERKHRVKNVRHALRYREEARLVAA